MNGVNKFARFMRDTGPARFFVPLGIVLIVFGIIMLGFNTDQYLETTGKITSVVELPVEQDESQEYDVSFTYTVDGKDYENTFSNISGTFNVGNDIKVYYDPADPEKVTNSKASGFIAPILIAAGAAALIVGVYLTVKAFKRSKELDSVEKVSAAAFEGFKNNPGVTEYYCRFDGKALKPGYIIEDANRRVLYEGQMTKQALVGARTYEFHDHTTGSVKEHQVGHVVTQSYNNEMFSVSSSFKFDGKNVWDVLHERGLRINTNLFSKFPRLIYEVSKDGKAFAQIETSSKYVHEDEEAQHKVSIPVGRYYYRFWTESEDFDLLFLTIFAISETEQTVVE